MQKVRGHDEDIHGISWSPSKFHDTLLNSSSKNSMVNAESDLSWRVNDVSNNSYEEDSLIAISSREKTISIWSSKSGRQLASLRLPGSGSGRNKGSSDKTTFNTCFWLKHNVLVSSGVYGELLEWNLDRLIKRSADGILRSSDGNSPEVQVLHREHNRTLYSISSTGYSIQTAGQDRSIVSYSSLYKKLDFNLPTFASWVYALAPNSVDPTIIAAGAGDGQIRIWKKSSKTALYDVNVIWQKLNSAKVTSLAWHPDKDNIIAFGTDEGRVGIVDAFSSRAIPTFCEFKHRSTVYNLCWGPRMGDNQNDDVGSNCEVLSTDKKSLYSCGDGQVMMHGAHKQEKTVDIETIIAKTNDFSRKPPSRSDLVFQPNHFKYLILGSDDGSIEIFSTPKLKILCVLKSFNKLIQSLAWHPTYIGSSVIPSSLQNFLATSSNEHDVHVWDLSKYLKESTDPNISSNDVEHKNHEGTDILLDSSVQTPIVTSPDVTLPGHHQRVIYLTWSPHEEGKLLSVSYDCTAQVWNVKSKEPISNFSGHTGRLFCGLWSPTDPNIVFTGGEDSTVYGWNMLRQKDKLPVKKNVRKNTSRKEKESKEQNIIKPDIFTNLSSRQIENESTQSIKEEGITAKEIEPVETLDNRVQDKNIGVRRHQKRKTYFPLSFQHENTSKPYAYDDCQKLYNYLHCNSNEDIDSAVEDRIREPHLGFYTDKVILDNLLAVETNHLKEQGDTDIASHLSLWSGDLITTIKDACNSGKLSDWLVSASAGISYALWKKACVSYAIQLAKQDEIVKGASYYLMIHEVLEAVNLLKKNHFYRPAIAIAKSRLPDNSPLLKEIYQLWANQATSDGSYELAAKCWIAAGNSLQASNLLAKRSDPSSLRVASYLAAKADDHEKSRILAAQCATLCIQTKDWKCMRKLVGEANQMEINKMWEDTAQCRLLETEIYDKESDSKEHGNTTTESESND